MENDNEEIVLIGGVIPKRKRRMTPKKRKTTSKRKRASPKRKRRMTPKKRKTTSKRKRASPKRKRNRVNTSKKSLKVPSSYVGRKILTVLVEPYIIDDITSLPYIIAPYLMPAIVKWFNNRIISIVQHAGAKLLKVEWNGEFICVYIDVTNCKSVNDLKFMIHNPDHNEKYPITKEGKKYLVSGKFQNAIIQQY